MHIGDMDIEKAHLEKNDEQMRKTAQLRIEENGSRLLNCDLQQYSLTPYNPVSKRMSHMNKTATGEETDKQHRSSRQEDLIRVEDEGIFIRSIDSSPRDEELERSDPDDLDDLREKPDEDEHSSRSMANSESPSEISCIRLLN